MLLLHHPGIGRQGGSRTHRRLFLRQTGLPVSFTCRLWWIRMELHHRCILRSRFTVCRLRFWPTDPFWRLSEVSIPIPFTVLIVFRTSLRAVAVKQAFLLEIPVRFGLTVRELQSLAFPLGYGIIYGGSSVLRSQLSGSSGRRFH